MRIYCAAILLLFGISNAFACTAGGVPCDQVHREQLQGIDRMRMENNARQEQIEQQQHRNNLARIQREKELREAQQTGRTAPPPPQPIQIPTTTAGRPTPNSSMPAECQAFPTMCSAYK